MSRYKISDSSGLYFITCTVVGWIDVFTRPGYRDMILESLTFCRRAKKLRVFAYVIMSNHLHLIVQAGEDATFSLTEILRDFRKFTALHIIKAIQNEPESRREWLEHMFEYHARYKGNRDRQFWAEGYRPIALYTAPVIWQKVNYIHQNPVRARIVGNPVDYLYSSARNYQQENEGCLVEIDLLEPWWTDVGVIR